MYLFLLYEYIMNAVIKPCMESKRGKNLIILRTPVDWKRKKINHSNSNNSTWQNSSVVIWRGTYECSLIGVDNHW